MPGKIVEQQGEKAKSHEQCRKFLDLGKDADPGIPEVEEAGTTLAGLKNPGLLVDPAHAFRAATGTVLGAGKGCGTGSAFAGRSKPSFSRILPNKLMATPIIRHGVTYVSGRAQAPADLGRA